MASEEYGIEEDRVVAEPADTGKDGKEVRILKDPSPKYGYKDPVLVDTISEAQARGLRNSLSEVLERL